MEAVLDFGLLSQRGRPLLRYEGKLYSLLKTHTDTNGDTSEYWGCRERQSSNCPGRLCYKIDDDTRLPIMDSLQITGHQNCPTTEQTIRHKIARRDIANKIGAGQSLREAYPEVMNTLSAEDQGLFSSQLSLQATAQRIARRNIHPLPPQNNMLHLAIPQQYRLTTEVPPIEALAAQPAIIAQPDAIPPVLGRGAQPARAATPGIPSSPFLLFSVTFGPEAPGGDQSFIHAWGTQEFLRRLLVTDYVHMDGTFSDKTPYGVYQYFALHFFAQGSRRLIPGVHVCMSGKSTYEYRVLLRLLRWSGRKHGYTIQWKHSMSDFETGLLPALQRELPGVEIDGCHFHYTAAVFKCFKRFGFQVISNEYPLYKVLDFNLVTCMPTTGII
jgi:FLYWCH zinc finger domain